MSDDTTPRAHGDAGAASSDIARSRCVVHLCGYHPIAPEQVLTRATRDFERFVGLWNVSGALSADTALDGPSIGWQAEIKGPDWQAGTSCRFFRWDDLITAERRRHWFTRLPLGLLAIGDFIAGGAPLRYLATSWRYTLFFLYPVLILALLAVFAWFAAGFVVDGGTRAFLAAILFAVALAPVGNRLYLDHLLDDWIHASALVRRPVSAVDTRLDALADELANETRELLIVGHSLGAVLAVHLIAKLRNRGFAGQIRFASAGSSILKIGLHRRALHLRNDVERIIGAGGLVWVDFQALNDVMNFYRSEPVSALGIVGPPAQTRIVRFRAAVAPERYRRLERNFFKLHNQFVAANDLKARYDFQMMTLGPFTLEALAQSEDGALSLLDGKGGLTEAGRIALTLSAA